MMMMWPLTHFAIAEWLSLSLVHYFSFECGMAFASDDAVARYDALLTTISTTSGFSVNAVVNRAEQKRKRKRKRGREMKDESGAQRRRRRRR